MRNNLSPNVLTIVGSIPSLLFFVLMLLHFYPLALIVFLGNAFDAVDGAFARATNRVTPFGGFLDSTIDRVVDFLSISAFGFAGIVRWEIVTTLVATSFLISYIRSRAELASGGNLKLTQGLIDRTPRLVVIWISLLLYVLFPIGYIGDFNVPEAIFVLLTILSLYTVVQRVLIAYRTL